MQSVAVEPQLLLRECKQDIETAVIAAAGSAGQYKGVSCGIKFVQFDEVGVAMSVRVWKYIVTQPAVVLRLKPQACSGLAAFLTRWTSPRLLFESTAHFPQSEIQSVFHSFGKSLVNPNPCAIISPPGEKCGLVDFPEYQCAVGAAEAE